jgi:2-polyprenyl-3-methyl-5-hydroxy-6-metoxy-1,4-benzoquinol methylase
MAQRWFKIAGEAGGDRTLAEQLHALRPALAECKGKTVLDLGCAEGLIAREFALAGAVKVLAVDKIAEHLEVARRIVPLPAVEYRQMDLMQADPGKPLYSDIVLTLGMLQKLENPERGLLFAARSCHGLLLMRIPRTGNDGIVRSKHGGRTCDARAMLHAEGFKVEKVVAGVPSRAEDVEYWRRCRREG